MTCWKPSERIIPVSMLGRVALRLSQQRALPRRSLDLLLGQDVDLLLAVRVAGEEVPDPVQQPLLLGEDVGLPDVEHGGLELRPGAAGS